MKKIMKIDGEEYRCHWQRVGWSYACPVIKKRGRFLGIPCWCKWSKDAVVSKSHLAMNVDAMLPNEHTAAFRDAIMSQLRYNIAWGRERAPDPFVDQAPETGH